MLMVALLLSKGTSRVKIGYKAHDSLKPDVTRPVPGVTTGPLMEGSSVEISSDATTSITEVDVPSDLPVSDAQIDRFPDEDPENLEAMELEGGFLSQESACTAPGIYSTCEDGPCSLPLQADEDPPCAPDVVGSVADSLDALEPPSIDYDRAGSTPRCKVLAPCGDICHPINFRRSTQDCLSLWVSVDDGPIPGADVELVPPSDGAAPETELAPVIDPNLTPSPIARIVKKYSLGVSKLEEPSASSSVGSSIRAKEKPQSSRYVSGAKCGRSGISRSAAFGPEWKGVVCDWNAKFPECCSCLQIPECLYLGSGVHTFSKTPEWLAMEGSARALKLLLNLLGAPGFGGDLIGCEGISGLSSTLATGGGHALRASVLAGFAIVFFL
ncbi:hypothetical protein Nepgr_033626 [Nepenthes gracilis]|uniref:Uncharacterized protein n=1 Tax=Nepenthes gracilis TaxID=150966 RepID=A0AAD3Y6R4_NEPGR|nr:hypothetical protein Nepgr_033626 [Nepenthes gracilis]